MREACIASHRRLSTRRRCARIVRGLRFGWQPLRVSESVQQTPGSRAYRLNLVVARLPATLLPTRFRACSQSVWSIH